MRLLVSILTLALAATACQSESEEASRDNLDFAGLVTRGQEAFKSGRFDLAQDNYQRALNLQPDSAMVYNLVGMAYRFQYNQKQEPELKKQEIAAFEKAVQLQPKFVVALVNLGSSHYYAGNKTEASRYFKQVVELAPNHPEAELLKKMIAESESPATEE